MVETRCKHGFLRSVVPCPSCDRRKARVVTESSVRVRGQGEVVAREGSFRCRGCGVEKPLSEYYVSRTATRGHQSSCKDCDNRKRVEHLKQGRGYV